MAKVTVCIPVHQAGDFIFHTVSQVLRQSYPDIVVQVGIEPPGSAEMSALEPLLRDPRLRVHFNEETLGWAENVSSMLGKVQTPYFLVLPHDDFLHHQYIDILLPILEANPDVVVSYGDIQWLSDKGVVRRSQILSDGSVGERIISLPGRGCRGTALAWSYSVHGLEVFSLSNRSVPRFFG